MLDRARPGFETAHLDVSLRREADRPYFQQLKTQIVSLIYFGKLRAGDRLPSARRLADQLVAVHDGNREWGYYLAQRQERTKWEGEEFNFLKRRGEVGTTEAFAERERLWEQLGF